MIDWREHIDDSERTAPARVRGVEVNVELILRLLVEGWTSEQLRSRFTGLGDDAIRACIDYGRETLTRRRELAIVRQRAQEADAQPGKLVPHEEVERQMLADEIAEGQFLSDDEEP